jgi:hypothetical protein
MTIARQPPVLIALAVAILAIPASAVRAELPSTRPAAASTLASFDQAFQQLYRAAQQRIVRVQVPVRIPYDHPLIKWRMQLDPKLRDQIDAARAKGETPRLFVEAPTTQPDPTVQAPPEHGNRIPLPSPAAVINLEYVGLILNAQGDVLLPLFIDKDYVDAPMQVIVDDTRATTATVSAADRQTSLSIVRLAQPAGTPVRFATTRPAAGALVLLISPNRKAARIGLWTGGQDDNAIVVNPEGDVCALVRGGHPMFPQTLAPIVDQLLRYGEIRRAKLGVEVRDVAVDDAQRAKVVSLGARTALRVEGVQADSPAAAAGVQSGDVIVAIAGEPVEDVTNFGAAVAIRRGNTDLLILRNGRERTITVDLQPEQ